MEKMPRYYDQRQRRHWRILRRLFDIPGGAEIALILAARFGRRLAARDIRRARRYGQPGHPFTKGTRP